MSNFDSSQYGQLPTDLLTTSVRNADAALEKLLILTNQPNVSAEKIISLLDTVRDKLGDTLDQFKNGLNKSSLNREQLSELRKLFENLRDNSQELEQRVHKLQKTHPNLNSINLPNLIELETRAIKSILECVSQSVAAVQGASNPKEINSCLAKAITNVEKLRNAEIQLQSNISREKNK